MVIFFELCSHRIRLSRRNIHTKVTSEDGWICSSGYGLCWCSDKLLLPSSDCLNLVQNVSQLSALEVFRENLAEDDFFKKKSGFIFFGTALIGWLAMFFTVPEVKGRSYQDLDELFEAQTPSRQFDSVKTSAQLAKEEQSKSDRPVGR